MSLLECMIGISLSIGVIAPVLQSGSHLLIQQTELERAWLVEQDASRALELMGKAIRMAGYREITSIADYRHSFEKNKVAYVGIEQGRGWNRSDLLWVKQEPAGALDRDCLGNAMDAPTFKNPAPRTKGGLRHQGFFVQITPGQQSGTLMCTSLDRQGRLQNTALMNHIASLHVELVAEGASGMNRKGVQIYLKTTASKRELSRFVAFRNQP